MTNIKFSALRKGTEEFVEGIGIFGERFLITGTKPIFINENSEFAAYNDDKNIRQEVVFNEIEPHSLAISSDEMFIGDTRVWAAIRNNKCGGSLIETVQGVEILIFEDGEIGTYMFNLNSLLSREFPVKVIGRSSK